MYLSLERIWILNSSLNKSNCLVCFNKNVFIRKNVSFIFSSILVDNLFHIRSSYIIVSIIENNQISFKRKVPSNNQTYLWHLCLGYINLNRIQRLVKSRALHSLVPQGIPTCESYIEGKITKRHFTSKVVWAKEYLTLVHIDVCGPFNV